MAKVIGPAFGKAKVGPILRYTSWLVLKMGAVQKATNKAQTNWRQA
ncbi:MAG: hypothetical protein QNL31_04845 [Flavobacteriaceae bacterium]